jgi:hypothetical protein
MHALLKDGVIQAFEVGNLRFGGRCVPTARMIFAAIAHGRLENLSGVEDSRRIQRAAQFPHHPHLGVSRKGRQKGFL